MRYTHMTIEEYVQYQRSTGSKVEKLGRTWWTEIRPFFFRPLNPFAEIEPEMVIYPANSYIGGCLHAVSPGKNANARMNLFVYDDVQNYSLGKLNEKHRYITRKGIRNFEARQLTDPEQFTEEAYDIYVSFFNRTHYQYKKERLDKVFFGKWARKLFDNPGLLIIGAYRDDKLSAVDISCYVEDLIIDDIFFSDTESLNLKVTDFLLHTIRETAASTDAAYLFRGLPTGHRALDESKLMRGCKVLQKPSILRINPVARYAAKLFMKDSYAKLSSITADYLPGFPVGIV